MHLPRIQITKVFILSQLSRTLNPSTMDYLRAQARMFLASKKIPRLVAYNFCFLIVECHISLVMICKLCAEKLKDRRGPRRHCQTSIKKEEIKK